MNIQRFKLVLLLLGISWATNYQPSTKAVASQSSAHKALIEEYCVGCHNQQNKTADISLEGLDYDNLTKHGEIWEKVLRKVRTEQMPPVKLPQPKAAERAAFVVWLESSLDKAAAARPNPGRPVMHRLNRAEYSNAIRDLLALDIQPGAALPIDDSGYGFDNIGAVLSLSPALLEKYMSAAYRVSRAAVGDPNMKPLEDTLIPRRDPPKLFGGPSRSERMSDDLPFYSRGGMSFRYYFPLDAEYQIRIKMPANPLTGDAKPFDLRIPIKAGLRSIGVAFLRDSAKPEVAAPAGGRRSGGMGGAPPPMTQMDVRLDGARIKQFSVPETADADALTITGPFNITGRGDTPIRTKIFVCRPASEKDELPCARKIISTLARRAFRRPVTLADTQPLFAFYEDGRKAGDFDAGIQAALEALLVSPDFLFRLERDPRGTAQSVRRVNDVELASRLSFFLWSSIPDDELLTLAEQRRLSDATVLQQQVKRMLDDPRSQGFLSNFGGQGLYLRNLETATPDPDAFPNFDEALRRGFKQETELFFESILREDRSVLDLLDANYTYLNQRLAEHYGIKGVYGSQFRRVALLDESRANRGGLLGQGSILTVTSYPNRTSVVQRGKWILENLLGAPPPPPPPDIPELKATSRDGRLLSAREQLEVHRANPTCASCHARMDPIGFALENYDGIGKWRTQFAGQPIDASGKLPNSKSFVGPHELAKLLLAAHKDEYLTAVTEKLMTYALGRGLESYDAPAVRTVMREAARENYRLTTLIGLIVKSIPFQMRRSS